MSTKGRIWPDLVLVWDSGKPPEFRVQCVITVNNEDAQEIQGLFEKKSATQQDMERAKRLVRTHMNSRAKRVFKDILDLGFQNPDPHTEGKIWPDRVILRNTMHSPEFRVQCEIALNRSDAKKIKDLLFGRHLTDDGIDSAQQLVVSHIRKGARQNFREIVDLGFKSRKQRLREKT